MNLISLEFKGVIISIKNSTDDRTKIPVKGKDGDVLHDVNEIKIKNIAYVFAF